MPEDKFSRQQSVFSFIECSMAAWRPFHRRLNKIKRLIRFKMESIPNTELPSRSGGAPIPPFLYGAAWKEMETERCVEQALEAGFRGIDTANQRKHYSEIWRGSPARRQNARPGRVSVRAPERDSSAHRRHQSPSHEGKPREPRVRTSGRGCENHRESPDRLLSSTEQGRPRLLFRDAGNARPG
jgi:hypothetical protein